MSEGMERIIDKLDDLKGSYDRIVDRLDQLTKVAIAAGVASGSLNAGQLFQQSQPREVIPVADKKEQSFNGYSLFSNTRKVATSDAQPANRPLQAFYLGRGSPQPGTSPTD